MTYWDAILCLETNWIVHCYGCWIASEGLARGKLEDQNNLNSSWQRSKFPPVVAKPTVQETVTLPFKNQRFLAYYKERRQRLQEDVFLFSCYKMRSVLQPAIPTTMVANFFFFFTFGMIVNTNPLTSQGLWWVWSRLSFDELDGRYYRRYRPAASAIVMPI
jgi:hypothetical protein